MDFDDVPDVASGTTPTWTAQCQVKPYAAGLDGTLPTESWRPSRWMAQLCKLATTIDPTTRAGSYQVIPNVQASQSDSRDSCPYQLDSSLNNHDMMLLKPWRRHPDFAYHNNTMPVTLILAGTHTAAQTYVDAQMGLNTTSYDTLFASLKTDLETHMAANVDLYANNRPINIVGFSLGCTRALWLAATMNKDAQHAGRTIACHGYNAWLGSFSALAPNSYPQDKLNVWHYNLLQELRSKSEADFAPGGTYDWVRNVTTWTTKEDPASAYWQAINLSNQPLWWGLQVQSDAYMSNPGISASYPLTEAHTVSNWTISARDTSSSPYTYTEEPIPVLTTQQVNNLLQGDWIITTDATYLDADPAVNSQQHYMLCADATGYLLDDVDFSSTPTMATLTAQGGIWGIRTENTSTSLHHVTNHKDPTIPPSATASSRDLICTYRGTTTDAAALMQFTFQRASDGAYLTVAQQPHTAMAANTRPVWVAQSNYNAADFASMTSGGFHWIVYPSYAVANQMHAQHPRRAYQSVAHNPPATLYNILPKDGTVEKYVIKYDDMSHSYGGGAVSPVSFYLTQMQAGPVYGIDLHSVKPNTWHQSPAPIIDANIEISGDESLWTMKSRYGTNPTDYIVEIHSTVATQYSRDFAPDVTAAQLTNVAAPFDQPTPAAATICQLTDFEYLSNSYSFKAKLRVMNLPVASSYLVFAESGSSDPTTNGFYGAFSYGTQANATVLKFIKTTTSLIIS